MVSYLWLATYVAMLVTGNLLFKRVGLVMQGQSALDGFVIAARTPALYAAVGLYGIATLLWIWLLSRISLSQAYPWIALQLAVVPLLAWLVFDERVQPVYWVGIGFVVVGVLLTQYASQAR